MTEVIVRIFDLLKAHRSLCLAALVLTTAALAVSLSRQHYKEDISDFLPMDGTNAQALRVFQEAAGSSRIIAVISLTDNNIHSSQAKQALADAADRFTATVEQRDTTGIAETLLTGGGTEQTEEALQFVYSYMPLFLTDDEYRRMDSLLSEPGYIQAQLAADKQMLLLPMSGMMAQAVTRDPLNLFAPAAAAMQQRQPAAVLQSSDGYIFMPDSTKAIVLMKSPYGSSETSRNSQLLSFLEDCAADAATPGVEIRFTGGPVIAVGNAGQIKKDSLLAMSLALVLITGMLFAVFRRAKSLVLIVVAIAWGWLFAMGTLALLRDSVSLIVIGISSVILGIAVNYPLHLTAHLRHTPDVRQALREIAVPLLVGNITTVGAFLALAPLQSAALRDLGLFSSLLLVGTILFVLIFMPQMMNGTPSPRSRKAPEPQNTRQTQSPPKSPWLLAAVIATITVVLGYFSLGTTFDANLAHINYMTAQQRQDLQSLSTLFPESPGSWLPSRQQQEHRLALWRSFKARHGSEIETTLPEAARAEGFADDTFDPFLHFLHDETQPQPIELFDPSTIATRLSADFNYIGFACGLIVFVFLWFSFGSLELAMLAFLPMAVSWVWILGMMSLLGIHFNLVNIILATFIFGQGDDYTIFMTEGCQYEYAYRRPMLPAYKKSIVLSALIMLIGIGTLIVARHPALLSLAQVTIVGMFAVVLMAWLLPPLIFRWLVADAHGYRRRPLSFALLLRRLRGERRGSQAYLRHLVLDRYRYKGAGITRAVRQGLRRHGATTELAAGTQPIAVIDCGYGELPLLLALEQPARKVYAIEADDDKLLVARHSAEGLAHNITFMKKGGPELTAQLTAKHNNIKIIQL